MYRIKNVLNFKKPVFWLTIVAIIAVIAVCIGLLTNPKTDVGVSASIQSVEDINVEKPPHPPSSTEDGDIKSTMSETDAALNWAKTLAEKDVKSIELMIEPSLMNEQYRKYSADEFADIVAIINQSKGEYLEYTEQLSGSIQTLYVTTQDGEKHSITNGGDVYLIIDRQFYKGHPDLLKAWDFKGNAVVPRSFYRGAEEVEMPINPGEMPPADFVDAIAKSFNIVNGAVEFSIPKEPPGGFSMSELSIRVGSTIPESEKDATARLSALEKVNENRRWQLGETYTEKTFTGKIPDTTKVYINIFLTNEVLHAQHHGNSIKIFPLRDDTTIPSTKISDNTVTFTDRFADTLKLSFMMPDGWTMKASTEKSQDSVAPDVEIYNGSSLIGSIFCNSFDLYRDEKGNIPYMSVYFGMMGGSGASWDGEYIEISQTKDTCTAICTPWHRIDVPGVSGASLAYAIDKGILSYDAKLLKFVAIKLNEQAVSSEQWLSIAKSVKLS